MIANSEMLQNLGKKYQFAPDKKTGKPKSFLSSHKNSSSEYIDRRKRNKMTYDLRYFSSLIISLLVTNRDDLSN